MNFLRYTIWICITYQLYCCQDVTFKISKGKTFCFEQNFLEELPVILQFYDNQTSQTSNAHLEQEIVDLKTLLQGKKCLNLSRKLLDKFKALIQYNKELKEQDKPSDYILNNFNKHSLYNQINLSILADYFGNQELSYFGALSIANNFISNLNLLQEFRQNRNFFWQINQDVPSDMKVLISYCILSKYCQNITCQFRFEFIKKICKRLLCAFELLDSNNKIFELILSPNSNELILLTKNSSKLNIFRQISKAKTTSLRTAKNSKCISYSPNGKLRAICCDLNNIYISDLNNLEEAPVILNRRNENERIIEPITALSFTSDSTALILSTQINVYILDCETGKILKKIQSDNNLLPYVFSCEVEGNSKLILIQENGECKIINLSNYSDEKLFTLNVKPEYITNYADKYLAILAHKQLIVYDITKNEIFKIIELVEKYKKILFTKLSDSPGGLYFIGISQKETLGLWHLQSGNHVANIDNQIKDFVFDSLNLKLIALSSNHTKLKAYDLKELSAFLSDNDYLLEQILFLLAFDYCKKIKINKEKEHIQEIYGTFRDPCKKVLSSIFS